MFVNNKLSGIVLIRVSGIFILVNVSSKSNEQVSSNNNSPNRFETFTNQINFETINSTISQINAELSTLKLASSVQSNTLNTITETNESLSIKQVTLESYMKNLKTNFSMK
jgi:hypothetical protein